MSANRPERDYSVFEADLAGKTLDIRLLLRLLRWVRPHLGAALWSAAAVLVASLLVVLGPVVVGRVVIDGILYPTGGSAAPTFGMDVASAWIGRVTGLGPLASAVALYGLLSACWAALMYVHRVLLATAVLRALRDLRDDLFRHLGVPPGLVLGTGSPSVA